VPFIASANGSVDDGCKDDVRYRKYEIYNIKIFMRNK